MSWTETKLNEMLTRPSRNLIEFAGSLEDDLAVLGAGGKVGASLAVLTRRAMTAAGSPYQVYAVSRFSDATKQAALEAEGVRTLSADLSDDSDLAGLPDFRNIIYLAGRKFGTTGDEASTWQANASVPTLVSRRFKGASIVVFSTGNIYPLTSPRSGGVRETTPVAPIGEYAMSSLARERIFEYAARSYGTKLTIFRLNFAVDLRYGVLNDIAKQILNDEPVTLTIPNFNCIWQGYVSEVAIRSLADASEEPFVLNVTGPEIVSTRTAAEKLGQHLGIKPKFGPEGELSFLSDASLCMKKYGYPEYGIDQLIEWQAEWIRDGGRDLGAPTHFEMNRGEF